MALPKDLPDSPEAIIDYLKNHPDFFVEHTDILSELNIPHNTKSSPSMRGNVASLIEYQVAQLRDENLSLNKNLDASEESIEHQRHLAKEVHDLSLELIQKDSLDALDECLTKNIRRLYQAEHFLFLVFKQTDDSINSKNIHFLNENSNLSFMFTSLFHHQKPLCDSLQTEHIEALFQNKTEKILSTALAPVQQSDWHGLFALGSKTQNIYSHGFEMDLLNYIAMISAAMVETIIFNQQSD